MNMSVFLKCVTLENFKTFKGRTEIDLRKSFTCIYGVNGTGKSNLLDAIMFALGAKIHDLRISNLNDLIYKSEDIQDIKHCSVTLKLQINNKETTDFQRCLDAMSNKCSFFINEQFISGKEYIRQLGDLVSLNCAILQGTVENLVHQLPNERTRFLEEICGSAEYALDYIRLQKKFEKACSNYKLLQNDIKKANKEKKDLKVFEDVVQKYNELSNKHKKLKCQVALCSLYNIEKEIEEKMNQYENLNVIIANLRKDNQKSSESIEAELRIKKQQFRDLQLKLAEIEQVLNNTEANGSDNIKIIECKERITHEEKIVVDAKINLSRAENAYKKCMEVLEDLKTQQTQVNHMKDLYIADSPSEYFSDIYEEQISKYTELKNIADKKTYAINMKLEQLALQKSPVDWKRNNLNRKLKEEQHKLEENKTLLTSLLMEIKDSKTRDIDLTRSITNLQNIIKELEHEEKTLLQQLEDVQNELKDEKYEKVEQRKTQEMEQMDFMLRKQFGHKIYGRLHTLCKSVHNRYLVALTKLLLKHRNSYVVDKKKTAEKCITYLHENKIGRATFLPLDYIQWPVIKENLRNIQRAKLAYDCLTFDERISKVVLFVVKNALICENEDEANYLSKTQNTDCVSLDGSLYNRNGVFSGGKLELEQKAKQWSNINYEKLKKIQNDLRQQIFSCKESIIKKKYNLQDLQAKHEEIACSYFSMNSLESKVELIKNNIAEAKNNIENISTEISENVEPEMNNLNDEEKNLQNKIKEITKQIFFSFCQELNITNIEDFEKHTLSGYKERLSRCNDLEIQLERISKQIINESEHAKEAEENIKKWKATTETSEKQLLFLQQEYNELIQKYERDNSKIANAENVRNTILNDIKKIQYEINSLRNKVQKFESEEQIREEQKFVLKNVIYNLKIDRNNKIRSAMLDNIDLPFLTGSPSDMDKDSVEETSSSEEICEQSFYIQLDYTHLPENFKNKDSISRQNMLNSLNENINQIYEEMQELQKEASSDFSMDNLTNRLENVNERLQNYKQSYKTIEAMRKATQMNFEIVQQARHEKFTKLLNHLNNHLSNIYKELTNDSTSCMMLIPEDPEQPYMSGLRFMCKRTDKPLRLVEDFSGGEKTIVGLTLICAIQSWKPSFLLIDEIDAALSPENIVNLCKFFNDLKDTVQIISVSLNPLFYSKVDAIIGTSASDGYTEVIAVDVSKYSD